MRTLLSFYNTVSKSMYPHKHAPYIHTYLFYCPYRHTSHTINNNTHTHTAPPSLCKHINTLCTHTQAFLPTARTCSCTCSYKPNHLSSTPTATLHTHSHPLTPATQTHAQKHTLKGTSTPSLNQLKPECMLEAQPPVPES